MSYNKVILIGHVGKDPVVRYVDKRPVASFSLATTERAYTTASGLSVPERTEWHNIVMWDRAAEFAENISGGEPDCLSKENCGLVHGRTVLRSNVL